jgi:hypothetical protein
MRVLSLGLLLGLGCSGDKPETTDTTDTDTTVTTGTTAYHPEGFDDPTVHGSEAKRHDQTCTDCHGADLAGSGDAVSCDTCHEEGWRTDCTFCHGGTDNETGAPPQDLDGGTDDAMFGAHSKHVEDTIHVAFGCEQCHVVPEDVLSVGHMFDESPVTAEVDLSAGLSMAATWDGASCGEAYCHGNGQGDNGEIAVGDGPLGCDGCHASRAGPSEVWRGMSGEHSDHLRHDVGCEDCHRDTVDENDQIVGLAEHVNGTATFATDEQVTFDGKTCTGECHGERHRARSWER